MHSYRCCLVNASICHNIGTNTELTSIHTVVQTLCWSWDVPNGNTCVLTMCVDDQGVQHCMYVLYVDWLCADVVCKQQCVEHVVVMCWMCICTVNVVECCCIRLHTWCGIIMSCRHTVVWTQCTLMWIIQTSETKYVDIPCEWLNHDWNTHTHSYQHMQQTQQYHRVMCYDYATS